MQRRKLFTFLILVISFMIIIAQNAFAQDEKNINEQLITAARDIIETSKYCALITLDSSGHPQARTMQPFPPDDEMIIWFGTNPKSKKVKEIKNDPRITLYYGDPSGDGYAVITGTALLVNDPKEKEKRWMDEWDAFYPDKEESYLLIKVIPSSLEVVSYEHGLTGDSITWKAPSVKLDQK